MSTHSCSCMATALLMWATAVFAQPVPFDPIITFEEVVSNHFDDISSIQTCGHWENAGETGFYRIVVFKNLFGASRLFVQWMVSATEEEPTRSVYTLSLTPFNDRETAGFAFETFECRDRITKNGVTILFSATANDTGQAYRFDVRMGARPGRHVVNSWVE